MCIRDRTIDDYFDMVQRDAQDRHKLIKGYSHGMKNKVQMLLFLIARPPVILLDEPLTSFDAVSYTHLDVYKRQSLLYSTLPPSRIVWASVHAP